MRGTLRLLATVKPRYLRPGTPTGLTGLATHGSPRSTLLYLYNSTLDKLKDIPESSLYRQSVEALTKHRLTIVQAVDPPGHKEWAERQKKFLEENPDTVRNQFQDIEVSETGGTAFLSRAEPRNPDIRHEEWDGEAHEGTGEEGLRGRGERREILREQPNTLRVRGEVPEGKSWEPEPQMTADQVEEVERKIGAGLLEEVVEMAESEAKLVDIMKKYKVWEPLEEKPGEGQWKYFERHSE